MISPRPLRRFAIICHRPASFEQWGISHYLIYGHCIARAEERIERPIFVIGFGRTGTTLIHSLLPEDPGARAPKWWHTHEPSPPPGEVPVADARIELAAQDLYRLLHQAPGLLTLHPYRDRRGHCFIEDE